MGRVGIYRTKDWEIGFRGKEDKEGALKKEESAIRGACLSLWNKGFGKLEAQTRFDGVNRVVVAIDFACNEKSFPLQTGSHNGVKALDGDRGGVGLQIQVGI